MTWLYLLAAAVLAVLVYGMVWEAFAVRLTRVRMLCPRLPPKFDGFTLLQISDAHLEVFGRRERKVLKIAQKLTPDVVAITGDIAFGREAAKVMATIVQAAAASEGTYAVSGNADVRWPKSWAEVQEVLRAEGVEFLLNRHVILRRGEAQIILAGVEDPHTGLDDLPKALEGAPPNTFIFLLAHSPCLTIGAVEMGVDVMISGHTHGGQLRLPFVGPLLTRSGHGKELSSGYYPTSRLASFLEVDPGNLQVFVSRGIGSSFVPLRLLCPPEVTLIELVRG